MSATAFVELICNRPVVTAVTKEAILFEDAYGQKIRYVNETGDVEAWSRLSQSWHYIDTHKRNSADWHQV